MKPPGDLHNPARTSRILIVAGVFAVPGALGGALVAAFVGGFSICVVTGILLGAVIGSTVEALPVSSPSGIQVTEIYMDRPTHKLSGPNLYPHA